MEDLRSKSKKKEDTKIVSANNESFIYDNWYVIRLYKYVLKKYKLIGYIILILFVATHPYEIGKFIGDWIYNFKTGIMR